MLLSHEEAMRKLALGLNLTQLIVSVGGDATSMSLFAFPAGVVVEPPKLKELVPPPNNDMLL